VGPVTERVFLSSQDYPSGADQRHTHPVLGDAHLAFVIRSVTLVGMRRLGLKGVEAELSEPRSPRGHELLR